MSTLIEEATEQARVRVGEYFKERHGLTDDDLAKDIMLIEFVSSIGLLELLSFLETELAVAVDPGALTQENFGTVSQVFRFVGTCLMHASRAKS